MSRSLNKVLLIGHVGTEPEARTTSGGVKIVTLALATNRTWKDRNGQQHEGTEWHRVTFFGRLAEVVEEYVRKGDHLFVEGSLHYSTTTHDGKTSYWTEVKARELIMLGSRRQEAAAPAPHSDSEPEEYVEDDDLPF